MIQEEGCFIRRLRRWTQIFRNGYAVPIALVPKLHLGTQWFRQLDCRLTASAASLDLKPGAWGHGKIAKFNFAGGCVPKFNLGTSPQEVTDPEDRRRAFRSACVLPGALKFFTPRVLPHTLGVLLDFQFNYCTNSEDDRQQNAHHFNSF